MPAPKSATVTPDSAVQSGTSFSSGLRFFADLENNNNQTDKTSATPSKEVKTLSDQSCYIYWTRFNEIAQEMYAKNPNIAFNLQNYQLIIDRLRTDQKLIASLKNQKPADPNLVVVKIGRIESLNLDLNTDTEKVKKFFEDQINNIRKSKNPSGFNLINASQNPLLQDMLPPQPSLPSFAKYTFKDYLESQGIKVAQPVQEPSVNNTALNPFDTAVAEENSPSRNAAFNSLNAAKLDQASNVLAEKMSRLIEEYQNNPAGGPIRIMQTFRSLRDWEILAEKQKAFARQGKHFVLAPYDTGDHNHFPADAVDISINPARFGAIKNFALARQLAQKYGLRILEEKNNNCFHFTLK
jgi:hypothetical protein